MMSATADCNNPDDERVLIATEADLHLLDNDRSSEIENIQSRTNSPYTRTVGHHGTNQAHRPQANAPNVATAPATNLRGFMIGFGYLGSVEALSVVATLTGTWPVMIGKELIRIGAS